MILTDYAYNAYNYSDARIAKGDFIRMKEISLAYQVPAKVTNALRLSNAMLKLRQPTSSLSTPIRNSTVRTLSSSTPAVWLPRPPSSSL